MALAVVSLVLFLSFLDNAVLSVALANVQSELHAGVTALQWVVGGYALTFAGLMLVFGTLGDLFGRRRIMGVGVGIFWLGLPPPSATWSSRGDHGAERQGVAPQPRHPSHPRPGGASGVRRLPHRAGHQPPLGRRPAAGVRPSRPHNRPPAECSPGRTTADSRSSRAGA
jgi:hypothetical protein